MAANCSAIPPAMGSRVTARATSACQSVIRSGTDPGSSEHAIAGPSGAVTTGPRVSGTNVRRSASGSGAAVAHGHPSPHGPEVGASASRAETVCSVAASATNSPMRVWVSARRAATISTT